jgi:HD-like signal output (HDOD) protein
MSRELDLADAQRALQGITIPPRPEILVVLGAELRKAEPDIRVVADHIARDVGLSAAVLKSVNSPFFGLRNKTGSVSQAVQLLGVRSIGNLVAGVALRGTIAGDQVFLSQFWNDAEKVASIAAFVAAKLPGVSREESYAFGLFRDCGMTLLLQRFDDYRDTLELVLHSDRPMTEIEELRHGTNHAVVGQLMAKAWFLPDAISRGILFHHDPGVFDPSDQVPAAARTLVAINYVAEALDRWGLGSRYDLDADTLLQRSLSHLGFSATDYEDMRDETTDMVA